MSKYKLLLAVFPLFLTIACTQKDINSNNNQQVTNIPIIVAKPETILSQEACLNPNKESNCYSFKYNILTTQVDWLDNIFRNEACLDLSYELQNKQCPNANLQQLAKDFTAQKIKDMQEVLAVAPEMASADEYDVTWNFVGQKNNLVQFRKDEYSYGMGAAHGQYANVFRIFDLEKQKELKLDDIILDKNKFYQALKKSYVDYYLENLSQHDDCGDYSCKENKARQAAEQIFPSSDEEYQEISFQLTADGVVFYFQPYAIGSYSEGIIELTIRKDDANGVIKDDYYK